ncbi:hypothetical protein [Spongiactinospora sp. TRM90649]|uniref:hypothetical protein n=1 Tax=Spongiactinospora sp. TRM90649 TaxID=3031114 RepID=UPI0023F764AB|nr:hypothetical protein [Spongiactinospora sp. TRM90649]MDF5758774.1 hypothetical protein [Spongiactinospora sp. TRM90649]
MLHLRGDRARMTDPITCPECEGKKGHRVGELFLACRFCCGRGWVGGEHEPAERDHRPPPEPPPAWEHKVWCDPAVSAAIPCRYCLGSGKVINLGSGVQRGNVLTMADCPACTIPDDQTV